MGLRFLLVRQEADVLEQGIGAQESGEMISHWGGLLTVLGYGKSNLTYASRSLAWIPRGEDPLVLNNPHSETM